MLTVVPPIVRTALIVSLLSVLSRGAELSAVPPTPRLVDRRAAPQTGRDEPSSACPSGTLPDARVCVPVPTEAAPAALGALDWIPRRPDRPVSFVGYQFPVPVGHAAAVRPADPAEGTGPELQRDPRAPQSTAFEIEAMPGTSVTLPLLVGQKQPAQVIYVGTLAGLSVITRHQTESANQPRDYLLVIGHLHRTSRDLRAGRHIEAGTVIGFVGQSGSDRPQLHLEARQVRRGVDATRLTPEQLLDPSKTVPTDPRNVLPLKQ